MSHCFAITAAVLFIGCSTTESLPRLNDMTVRFAPRDFRSSFGTDALDTQGPPEWRGALALYWVGQLDLEMAGRAVNEISRGLHLVDLSTGTRVSGEARAGLVRADGELVAGWPDSVNALGMLSFVPSEPLNDGWYVLVADLREWMSVAPFTRMDESATVIEDGMMFVRVRIGSEPTWYQSVVRCDTRPLGRDDRGAWCDVGVAFSEPPGSFGTTRFELRVGDEIASDCVERRDSVALGWECPHYAEGTEFEIRLVESDAIRPMDGGWVQTVAGGGTGTRTEFVAPRFGIDLARSAR